MALLIGMKWAEKEIKKINSKVKLLKENISKILCIEKYIAQIFFLTRKKHLF